MNEQENKRRERLMKMSAERLPDIRKRFEEAQNRNFNSNFAPGGKDAKLVKTKKAGGKKSKGAKKKQQQPAEKPLKVNLSVSTRKGEMVHHQRMLSQDVNAQATQHIIGVPVNKSKYNGYGGQQVTNAMLKKGSPRPGGGTHHSDGRDRRVWYRQKYDDY